jgi:FkbM family methyltransferase
MIIAVLFILTGTGDSIRVSVRDHQSEEQANAQKQQAHAISCRFLDAIQWAACPKAPKNVAEDDRVLVKELPQFPLWKNFVGKQSVGVNGKNVAIDVGANTGQETLALAEAGLKVEAFEPVPWFHPKIEKRLEDAGIKKGTVTIHGMALSNTVSKSTIFVKGQRSSLGDDIRREGNLEGQVNISVAPLSEVHDIAHDRVAFVKIDAQGFDPRVLQGYKSKLCGSNPVPYVYFEFDPVSVHRSDSHIWEPLELMRGCGYVLFDAHAGYTKGCAHKDKKERDFKKYPMTVEHFLEGYLPPKNECWTNVFAIHHREAQAILEKKKTREGISLR